MRRVVDDDDVTPSVPASGSTHARSSFLLLYETTTTSTSATRGTYHVIRSEYMPERPNRVGVARVDQERSDRAGPPDHNVTGGDILGDNRSCAHERAGANSHAA